MVGGKEMDNWVFVFIANIIGGIIVFFALMFLLSLGGGSMDTVFFIGIFLLVQLSFITTILFQVLHRVKKLESHQTKPDEQ
jgi:ABC-type Fe3+-siderophore transport system permease subunit